MTQELVKRLRGQTRHNFYQDQMGAWQRGSNVPDELPHEAADTIETLERRIAELEKELNERKYHDNVCRRRDYCDCNIDTARNGK